MSKPLNDNQVAKKMSHIRAVKLKPGEKPVFSKAEIEMIRRRAKQQLQRRLLERAQADPRPGQNPREAKPCD